MAKLQASTQLTEALGLYDFVDRDIEKLSEGEIIDAARLRQTRHALSERLRQLSLAIETDAQLAENQALALHMKSLLADLTAAWMRHQHRYPADAASRDRQNYLVSAAEVKSHSAEFRQWCSLHLDL